MVYNMDKIYNIHKLEQLISEEDISKKVSELAVMISKDFKEQDIVIVSVLKGSFIFVADLVRKINFPLEIGFIVASSYGSSIDSSEDLKIQYDVDLPLENKTVILVEDIVDTGYTLANLKEYLYNKGAKCVKICAIFDKPSRRKIEIDVDYQGFIIPNEFVVGYGLDYDNKYRNLKNLYKIVLKGLEDK